jgi:hypothetical protein
MLEIGGEFKPLANQKTVIALKLAIVATAERYIQDKLVALAIMLDHVAHATTEHITALLGRTEHTIVVAVGIPQGIVLFKDMADTA